MSSSPILICEERQKNPFKLCVVEGISLPETWHKAVAVLMKRSNEYPCPDYNENVREMSMELRIYSPLKEGRISRLAPCSPQALYQYELEVLDGILDFCIDQTGDSTYWAYTYHDRMTNYPLLTPFSEVPTPLDGELVYTCTAFRLNQVEFCIDELQRNPFSRRAVIDVRNNRVDAIENSPACLQNIQFMVRDGLLNMFVHFRSNDLFSAAYMNMWAFIRLQEYVASRVGVPVGIYIHRSNSMHIYERMYQDAENVTRAYTTRNDEDLCYNYVDFYKSEMESTKPEIDKLVLQLKDSRKMK